MVDQEVVVSARITGIIDSIAVERGSVVEEGAAAREPRLRGRPTPTSGRRRKTWSSRRRSTTARRRSRRAASGSEGGSGRDEGAHRGRDRGVREGEDAAGLHGHPRAVRRRRHREDRPCRTEGHRHQEDAALQGDGVRAASRPDLRSREGAPPAPPGRPGRGRSDEFPGRPGSGNVDYIGPTVDAGSGTFEVIVRVRRDPAPSDAPAGRGGSEIRLAEPPHGLVTPAAPAHRASPRLVGPRPGPDPRHPQRRLPAPDAPLQPGRALRRSRVSSDPSRTCLASTDRAARRHRRAYSARGHRRPDQGRARRERHPSRDRRGCDAPRVAGSTRGIVASPRPLAVARIDPGSLGRSVFPARRARQPGRERDRSGGVQPGRS